MTLENWHIKDRRWDCAGVGRRRRLDCVWARDNVRVWKKHRETLIFTHLLNAPYKLSFFLLSPHPWDNCMKWETGAERENMKHLFQKGNCRKQVVGSAWAVARVYVRVGRCSGWLHFQDKYSDQVSALHPLNIKIVAEKVGGIKNGGQCGIIKRKYYMYYCM